eukprot:gene19696-25618_t
MIRNRNYTPKIDIYLNVYDISEQNSLLFNLGLGFYHTGVVIDGSEYTFSQSGVFSHTPRDLNGSPAAFRENIKLGTYNGSSQDIQSIISDLRSVFKGSDYHIVNRNCNSFSNELSLRLLGKEIPSYINRMANIGSYFSCLIDPLIANASTNNQPTNQFPQLGATSNYKSQQQAKSFTAFSGSGRKLGS